MLEAGVAAHRGPTPCRAVLTVDTVPFVTVPREASSACCFCAFWGRPVCPLAVVAPLKEKRLPERLGRVLWLPVAPLWPTTTGMRGAEDARRRRSAAAFGAGLGNKKPPRGLRGALPSPPQAWGTCFSPPVAAAGAAGAGPLVISAQNDLAVGSRRPKRRWEAATHRKRVPAHRRQRRIGSQSR